ncbi:MAG: hypothetical protein FWD76_06525, partial [Firmicutes bacterium]|nr:hypothetical protein [Bacillota bacterium]
MDKIALIDIGSNSIRMVMAYVLPSKHFVPFEELKESVRLGQDVMGDGLLRKARVEQAMDVLRRFKKICNSYDIDKVIAVATSVLRRAKNQKSFLEEAESVCGFRVRVLDETQEAEAIYCGVINSLEIPKGLIVDISGSSFWLIQYNRRNILNIANLKMGSITLTQMMEGQGLSQAEQAATIEKMIGEQLEPLDWLTTLDPETVMIGAGGAFRNIASINQRIVKYSLNVLHNYTVTKNEFDGIYDTIKVLDVDKKATVKGLSSERADIFSAAMSCIKALL